MNLDNLAGMFLQRTGAQQSVGSTVMSTIIGYLMQHFMQKGIGSFLGSGGKDQGSIKSALSQLGDENLNKDHALVRQVQHDAGLRDDNQARQYTQQAVGMLRENADNDPQGLSSLLGNFGGGKGFDIGSLTGGKQKGGIGDIWGL
jgi:hypothetical protein